MATHYTSTTKTYTVKDTYSSYWMQAYLSVTVDGNGNGSWSMTMTNDTGGRCVGSLVFSINGSMIHDLYYDGSYDPSASSSPYTRSKGFPIRDDSTASGTFKVSGGSFLIGLAVCRSQAAVTYDTDTNRNRLVDGTAARVGSEKPSGGSSWQAYHVKFSRSYWTDNTAGSAPTITDGKNSTFTISGHSGTAGHGNSITETKLQYKRGSGDWTTCSGNSLSTATAINCGDTTASQVVKARTRYKCSRGGNDSGYIYSSEASATIKNYEEPTLPEKAPSVSYSKSRFTIKENWTFKWDGTGQAATATNTSSPVKGYRVVLLKNGSSVPIVNSAGKTISSNPSEPTWHTIDVSASTKTFTIYPVKNDFIPGDTVRLGIKPYSEDGNGKKVFNDSYKYSDTKTVQNAGIMHVCTAKTTSKTTWKEGQIMVYKNATEKWVEADIVKVRKTSSAWAEGN